MDKKQLYQAPSMIIYHVNTHENLLKLSSVQATFVSDPGIAETNDEIGTESRSSNDFWDE